MRPALLHDAPGLVHHLHGTCNHSPGEMTSSRFEVVSPGRDATIRDGRGVVLNRVALPFLCVCVGGYIWKSLGTDGNTGICGKWPARHWELDLPQEEASWAPVPLGVYGGEVNTCL